MKTFMCEFDEAAGLERFNAPRYIRGDRFNALKLLHKFEVMGKEVEVSEQKEWLDSAINDAGGWCMFVCGIPEQIRLFAFQIMRSYYDDGVRKMKWHYPNGGRYDPILDERKALKPHLLVIDSLLTHPPMHPNGNRGYDPSRIGKIFDIVALTRGVASTIILCPDLMPEEAYRTSMVQPDFMFLLKAKRLKEVDL